MGIFRIILLVLAVGVVLYLLYHGLKRRPQPMSVRREPLILNPNSVDTTENSFKSIGSIQKPISSADRFIVITVAAKEGQRFGSYGLLQAISGAGLKFGDMNIFHYHDPSNQKVLFSLAQSTEPGEFDIDRMGSFSCAGLSLFMDAEKVEDPLFAFERLLETANQLAEDLEGELYIKKKTPLTEAHISHYRQNLKAS